MFKLSSITCVASFIDFQKPNFISLKQLLSVKEENSISGL